VAYCTETATRLDLKDLHRRKGSWKNLDQRPQRRCRAVSALAILAEIAPEASAVNIGRGRLGATLSYTKRAPAKTLDKMSSRHRTKSPQSGRKEDLKEPSENRQRILGPSDSSAPPRSGGAEARAAAAERMVLNKTLAAARVDLRLATIALRRAERALKRQRMLMDRAVAREHGRTENAKRRAEKWQKKHNRVTSTLVWRVYSLFSRALCRIRTVLRPAHPATEVMAIAKLQKVAAAKDLAPPDIETRKKDRAIGGAKLKMTDSSFGKKGGDQLSSDGGDQSTAPHANEESRAPTLYRGPSLETLKSAPQRGRIAVVLHLFYPELWPEFRDALTFIPEPFDLFITLVAGHSEEGEDWIRADYPVAQIVTVENRGRDILPFILLINSGVLNRYHLVCKLHTKRTLRREDGDDWRRALLGGVLLDEVHVASILAAFDADPELGIVVADGCIWSDNKNVGQLDELCARAGIPGVTAESGYPDFPAGSIFWIRSSLLRPIASLMLAPTDFEPEPLPRDGCTPHAVERFLGHVCHQAGMRVAESSVCNTGQTKGGAPTKEYRPVTGGRRWVHKER
jgi:hypothetical protein